jgi:hypothetical protein
MKNQILSVLLLTVPLSHADVCLRKAVSPLQDFHQATSNSSTCTNSVEDLVAQMHSETFEYEYLKLTKNLESAKSNRDKEVQSFREKIGAMTWNSKIADVAHFITRDQKTKPITITKGTSSSYLDLVRKTKGFEDLAVRLNGENFSGDQNQWGHWDLFSTACRPISFDGELSSLKKISLNCKSWIASDMPCSQAKKKYKINQAIVSAFTDVQCWEQNQRTSFEAQGRNSGNEPRLSASPNRNWIYLGVGLALAIGAATKDKELRIRSN